MDQTLRAVAAVAALFAASTAAQVPTRPYLPLDLAKEMAEAAQAHCAQLGYYVSVHVVDGAGDTLVAYRGEGSGVHTFVNSYRKAYTAMTFDRPSAEFSERLQQGNVSAQLQLMLPDMAGQQGGLPVRAGGVVIGGIGASGGGMGADTLCVQAGIDAVADRLD